MYKSRTHPRYGLLYLTPGQYKTAWQQHRSGATDAEMAACLPHGRHALDQYVSILEDWDDRQAFLQARGQTDQLNREQLFITAIQEITDEQS
jgi:hypothetical protein